jgi:hypothetical protein
MRLRGGVQCSGIDFRLHAREYTTTHYLMH